MTTLKLTKPMMHGMAVRRLQEMCDLLGFDTGDNDGIFGPATDRAVRALQTELGVAVDGLYGPKTERAARKRLAGAFSGAATPTTPSDIVDITKTHQHPKNFSHIRRWRDIDGVTLHQTGCAMPTNPLGWGRVNAHYGLTSKGVAILINDPTSMIWHAQGLSKSTIGVEISGNYPGVVDRPGTLWKGGGGPHHLTPEMQDGAERIRRDIVRRMTVAGTVWRYLYAHRQSSDTRRGDPGEEIWRHIATSWAELSGCIIDPEYVRGKGRPLPTEWNADYEGEY